MAAERALDGVFGFVEVGSGGGGRKLVRGVAERIAVAESRAAVAEWRYERLRRRRAFRVGVAVGESVRPWEWFRFPGRLRAALRRMADPVEPVRVDANSVLGEIAPVGDVLYRGKGPDYSYLRVGHWGPVVSFGSVAPHFGFGSVEDAEGLLEDGLDLVLLEPVWGVEVPGFLVGAVERFVAAGVPVVLFARSVGDLQLGVPGLCSVVVADDVGVAAAARERFGDRVVSLVPFVEDRVFNPVGWKRDPEQQSVVVFVPVTKSASNHPALDGLIRGGDVFRVGEEPVADPGEFGSVAKKYPVAVVDPSHFVAESSFLLQVLRLVACGVPVITTGSPNLGVVFPGDGLVVVVDSAEEARAALGRFVEDPVERERHSVRARQYVLENHTARRRFDLLLSGLGFRCSLIR